MQKTLPQEPSKKRTGAPAKIPIVKARLERLYRTYNRGKYVHPDPLEFLYRYPSLRDREIAGLVASALAYGRVAQILKSVERALSLMRPAPAAFIEQNDMRAIARVFRGFKHRLVTGRQMAALLANARRAIAQYGSLNQCFVAGMTDRDETVLPALCGFAAALTRGCPHLVPCPERGSACKRLNLYLRWMVRHDEVDPGGWTGVDASKLVVPLDTHMARIGRMLGFTLRKTPDMRMALDITRALRNFAPDDPVKYDFALTRFGIRGDLPPRALHGLM